MSTAPKLSFKDQTLKLREQAVLDATTRLLASKGFDLMTMDDVAAEAGISKPILYKHFKSKEELATEVMCSLLEGAIAYLGKQDGQMSARERLGSLLEWALRVRLQGGLPFLPSTSPHVREMLTRSPRYLMEVFTLNTELQGLVNQAKERGEIRADLPTDVILYAYYARTCDPAVDYMKEYGQYSDDDIVSYMHSLLFAGVLKNQT